MKNILMHTVFYRKFNELIIRKIVNIKFLRRWLNRSSINPISLIKQRTVKRYAKQFSLNTLIETGTCGGEMLLATRKIFKEIHSIELSEFLYKFAKKRLAKYKHISLYQGNSSEVLPKLLTNIKQPCLFWLDAHYSGGLTTRGDQETPIMKELVAIFNHPIDKHVVLIDDAYLFTGEKDYPKLEEVKKFISTKRKDLTLSVKFDIIRIHKKI